MNKNIKKLSFIVNLFILGIGITILPSFCDHSDIVNAQATTRKSKTDMNFPQIKKGNYTSLFGNWELVGHAYNSYDKEGGIRWHAVTKKDDTNFKLIVSKKKISFNKSYAVFKGKFLKVKNEKHKRKLKFRMRQERLTAVSDGVILWEIDFYPKGVTLVSKVGGNKPVSIDTERDRIVIFTSNMGSTLVFQKN